MQATLKLLGQYMLYLLIIVLSYVMLCYIESPMWHAQGIASNQLVSKLIPTILLLPIGTWHVHHLKSYHVNPTMKITKWLQDQYRELDSSVNNEKAVRGKRHKYLGMILDYSTQVVEIGMTRCDQRPFLLNCFVLDENSTLAA